jgi:hypothetical protein
MSILRRRTLKILAILVVAYMVLLLAAYLGPPSLAEASFYVVLIPYASLHVFTHIGVPGLLEHNGMCGWGWCSPTLFGWIFVAALWIGLACLAAWLLAKIITALTPNS